VDPPAPQLVLLRALCAYACCSTGSTHASCTATGTFGTPPAPATGFTPSSRAARPGRPAARQGPGWQASVQLTWPLLADRRPRFGGARRAAPAAGRRRTWGAGGRGVRRTTADGVFEFQRRHGMELTGMIGGGSWPLLAGQALPGLAASGTPHCGPLLAASKGRRVQVRRRMSRQTWQRLLSTAAEPCDRVGWLRAGGGWTGRGAQYPHRTRHDGLSGGVPAPRSVSSVRSSDGGR